MMSPPTTRVDHIGIYRRRMAGWGSGHDRRRACAACAHDQIYDRSASVRRATVRVGMCREPYILWLCEPHLAQLRRILPKGGVWVIERQVSGSKADNPSPTALPTRPEER